MKTRPKDPLARLKRRADARRPQPIVNRPPDAMTGVPLPLVEMLPTPQMAAAMLNDNNDYLRVYRLGDCSVIVTREFGTLHLSIAHPRRLPTWDEVAQARYRLLPLGLTYAMVLPPVEEYVNVHRYCFQLHEVGMPADGVGPYLAVGEAVTP